MSLYCICEDSCKYFRVNSHHNSSIVWLKCMPNEFRGSLPKYDPWSMAVCQNMTHGYVPVVLPSLTKMSPEANVCGLSFVVGYIWMDHATSSNKETISLACGYTHHLNLATNNLLQWKHMKGVTIKHLLQCKRPCSYSTVLHLVGL